MDSEARTVPAAALTAYGTEQLQRAVDAGYQLFLSKPIAAEELATSLSKLVAEHRSEPCLILRFSSYTISTTHEN